MGFCPALPSATGEPAAAVLTTVCDAAATETGVLAGKSALSSPAAAA
jgi:hypothetical protein